jgi:hypothetical protein
MMSAHDPCATTASGPCVIKHTYCTSNGRTIYGDCASLHMKCGCGWRRDIETGHNALEGAERSR